jgi:hypothetical protein
MPRPANHSSQPAEHPPHHPSTNSHITSPPSPARKLSTAKVSVNRPRCPQHACHFPAPGTQTSSPGSSPQGRSDSCNRYQSSHNLCFKKTTSSNHPKHPAYQKGEKNGQPVKLLPLKSHCTLKLKSGLRCPHFFRSRSVHTTAPLCTAMLMIQSFRLLLHPT